jgi:hypothetical protein
MYGAAEDQAASLSALRPRPSYGPGPSYEVAHAADGRALAAQMHTITPARDCHIRAIVDDHARARSGGAGRHGLCYLGEQPGRQTALPKLNEIDAGGDRLFEPVDQR